MLSKEEQLKNKANFMSDDGKIYLVRCMNCPNAGSIGRENYAMAVALGRCAWCGWYDETETEES